MMGIQFDRISVSDQYQICPVVGQQVFNSSFPDKKQFRLLQGLILAHALRKIPVKFFCNIISGLFISLP